MDCTLGLGGHAASLLTANPTAHVIGIDRDPEALRLAESRLQPFAERVRLLPGEFSRLEELLEAAQVEEVDGILADILEQQKRPQDALETFQNIQRLYPTSPKVPEALYRIAELQIELDDVSGAKATLERIMNTYPGSMMAMLARDRLDEIG